MKHIFWGIFLTLIPQVVFAQATQFYLEDRLTRDWKTRIYVVADVHAKTQIQSSLYRAVDHARETGGKFNADQLDSELGRINAAGHKGSFMVSRELAQAIAAGLKAAKMTRGAFDIVSRGGNYRSVGIRAKTGELTLKQDGIRIDLKNIARGVLADIIAEDLLKEGWQNLLVKVDTVFVTRGSDAVGPWKVPVMTPSNKLAARMLFYKAVGDVSASTFPSSTRSNGLLATPDLLSATIFGTSGAEAEALSVALYGMGDAQAHRFLKKNKHLRAVLEDGSGNLQHIPDWNTRVAESDAKSEWIPEPSDQESRRAAHTKTHKPERGPDNSSSHSVEDTL